MFAGKYRYWAAGTCHQSTWNTDHSWLARGRRLAGLQENLVSEKINSIDHLWLRFLIGFSFTRSAGDKWENIFPSCTTFDELALVDGLVRYNPRKRLTPAEVINQCTIQMLRTDFDSDVFQALNMSYFSPWFLASKNSLNKLKCFSINPNVVFIYIILRQTWFGWRSAELDVLLLY